MKCRGILSTYPKLKTMKHLMTLAALFVSSLAMAQIPTFPWNPDGNGDGVIGSSDLIELLTVYGQEFQNAIVSENQESALLYMGKKKSYDCIYACQNLPGRWSLPEAGEISAIMPLIADTTSDSNLDTWLSYDEPWIYEAAADFEVYYPVLDAYLYSTSTGLFVRGIAHEKADVNNLCYCSIKQLPRVEYSACADVIDDPGCANQLVSDGWYPMGSVSDSGTQAFWRFSQ